MSQGRHSVFGALIVVIATILLTVGFVVAALLVGPDIQALLVRMVLVTLIIFLVILFLRYFTLLWFAYLGHAERNVLGVKKHHEMPAISVLVPAYNEGELMERAAESEPGGLRSFIKTSEVEIQEVLAYGRNAGRCWIAAKNTADEWVVSCDKPALDAITEHYECHPVPGGADLRNRTLCGRRDRTARGFDQSAVDRLRNAWL